ncbi:CvpA family protein [Candidatus Parcubacteria bacterium]|nr:CvpA family protein [Patescibacteria group bacterium]MCG2693751.1 CvpA family protein [Candidatus Parcubacteria bacterium]
MAFIDLIFLVVLGGFALFGLWFGLIHTLGSLLGTLLGVFLASRWYDNVALWAQEKFSGSLGIWNFIAFIVLFILINRLVGFLFHIFERAFDLITALPFLKSINRLAGALMGLLEGAVVLGAIVFMAKHVPFGFEDIIAKSQLKDYFTGVFNVLLPLVPEALKKANEIIK